MIFYLGTHQPNWLGLVDVPLFVSHRRLMTRKSFPRALCPWALDSGGFTELNMHGRWVTKSKDYATDVQRYSKEIGQMEWCAPMDWMCEPFVLARTGLSIREHQERTIDSYCVLEAEGLPVVPVLQGWEMADYYSHVEQYDDAGIDLREHLTVGLGSVCRRQGTEQIAEIVRNLHELDLSLHGFGVKTRGLASYHDALASSDSMAWSFAARRSDPIPGHTHMNCANCLEYAMNWRNEIVRRLDAEDQRTQVGDLR